MTEVLYHDGELAQLYDAANPWSDDRAYCLAFAKGRSPVLDLGCGTGSLASAIARTHGCQVTGVDPAQAMLDQARHHDGHERVTWVCADAREVRLENSFDLIVMTGHAFQCFLTDSDRAALFATIAVHLAPGGRFIFDSRNPLVEEWREWTPEKSRHVFSHPRLDKIEAWNSVTHDAATQIAAYDWFYRLLSGGPIHHAPAQRIAFPSKDAIATQLSQAGLVVERWLGDWQGGPLTGQSPEIIAIGGLMGNPGIAAYHS